MKSKNPPKSKVNIKLNELLESFDLKGNEKLIDELNAIVESIQQEDNNLNKLHKNVPIGLYQTTPAGEFTFVNNWFAKILGYKSPNELINKKVSEIYADPIVRKEVVLSLNKVGRLKDTEVKLKRKEGECRTMKQTTIISICERCRMRSLISR